MSPRATVLCIVAIAFAYAALVEWLFYVEALHARAVAAFALSPAAVAAALPLANAAILVRRWILARRERSTFRYEGSAIRLAVAAGVVRFRSDDVRAALHIADFEEVVLPARRLLGPRWLDADAIGHLASALDNRRAARFARRAREIERRLTGPVDRAPVAGTKRHRSDSIRGPGSIEQGES